jgi:Kef-type K+ transport system membrane component KefB
MSLSACADHPIKLRRSSTGCNRQVMTASQTTTLLADVALIALVTRALGALARSIGQPAVVGEIFAGVLLGPTFFSGAIAHHLMPAGVRPFLSVLAQVGVVLFMFCVGLELDQRLLRRRSTTVTAVSIGSIALPAALGALLAAYLVQHHASHSHLAFVLFMSAAVAVTAFPVLARILADRGIVDTDLGQMALACAASNDVVAYLLLAVAAGAAKAGGGSAWRLALLVPYALVMLSAVRPLLSRLARSGVLDSGQPARVIGLVIPAVLGSAAASGWMGLSPVFGAFFAGAVMPRDARAAVQVVIAGGVEDLSRVILLPIFFVTAGLNVNLSQLGDSALTDLGLILAVAIGGKLIGTLIAARATGMPLRDSLGLAALMNTRGLTELILLTVGLQLGVIDRGLYSLMVVMALVTTAMAGPILRAIYREEGHGATEAPRLGRAASAASQLG